jgi:hypothetical protein
MIKTPAIGAYLLMIVLTRQVFKPQLPGGGRHLSDSARTASSAAFTA